MAPNRKQIAGIAAVAAATAYGLTRWRGGSSDAGARAPVTEQQSPADD
jgi:hypothetical protein